MLSGAASAVEETHLTSIRARPRGFTYLGVLFLISVLAITAAAASAVWSVAGQRDAERELVFVGRQFALAIERYRARSTDPVLTYPRRLEDLLRDDRGVTPQHHLRRLYVDPMTGDSKWGLIRLPDGGIVGVHSLSDRKPFPRTHVVAGFSAPESTSYREWQFIAPSAADLAAMLSASRSATQPEAPGAPAPTSRTAGTLQLDAPPKADPRSLDSSFLVAPRAP